MPPRTRGAKTTERGESSRAGASRRNTRVQQEEENEGTRRRGRGNQEEVENEGTRRRGRGNEEERNVQFENMANTDRQNALLKRPIEPNRYIDDDELEMIGIQEEVHQYIRNIGWERFVAIQEPTYPRLLCQFLSTITFKAYKAEEYPLLEGTIQFKLGGREFSLSTAQFGVACGLYTEEEIQGGVFDELVSKFPYGYHLDRAWSAVAPERGSFNARNTKSTRIPSPALRYMHRFVAFSINGRGDSQGSVTKADMFYLWCMVTERKCNTAFFLAKYLHHKGQGDRGKLCGGAYVTRLARNLGVLEPIPRNAVPIPMQPISIVTLVRMNVLMRLPDGTIQFIEDSDDDVPAEVNRPVEDEQPPSEHQEEPQPPAEPLLDQRLQRLESDMQAMQREMGAMTRREKRMERALRQFMRRNDIPYPSSSADSGPSD